MPDHGLSGGLQAPEYILMIIGAFTAIAWYNCIELNIMIWVRFKKHEGLYFWSLLFTSWGIALHALSFLVKFFQIWKYNYVTVTLIIIGWVAMVSGQSLVLYSRLHLIMRNNRKVKWVLYMILTNAFLLHVPTTVLTYGANSPKADIYVGPYSTMEKIQITIFCVQEFIISCLYVFYTRKMLAPGAAFQRSNARQVMRHLILINLLIIVLDFTLLGTEFANHYEIQTTYKSALYSIKLKLEFAILNQLVTLTSGTRDYCNNQHRNCHGYAPKDNVFGLSGQGMEPSVQSYTVSASRTSPLSRMQTQNENIVMKTVDVDVTVTDSCSRIDEAPEIIDGSSSTRDENMVTRPRRMVLSRSPTESEFELPDVSFRS